MTTTNTDHADLPVPTGLQLTALDPDFRENPYPILAELREQYPELTLEVAFENAGLITAAIDSVLQNLMLGSVLAFAVLATILTALIFGLTPAQVAGHVHHRFA